MQSNKRLRPKPKEKETLEAILDRPFCYYCKKDFDDIRVLHDHQKVKHFQCSSDRCHRRLNTIHGLKVHMSQVHKETLVNVPNADPDRDDTNLEIFGMVGVPDDIINSRTAAIQRAYHQLQAEHMARTGNPLPGTAEAKERMNKKPKQYETKEQLKARVRAAIAAKKARDADPQVKIEQANSQVKIEPASPQVKIEPTDDSDLVPATDLQAVANPRNSPSAFVDTPGNNPYETGAPHSAIPGTNPYGNSLAPGMPPFDTSSSFNPGPVPYGNGLPPGMHQYGGGPPSNATLGATPHMFATLPATSISSNPSGMMPAPFPPYVPSSRPAYPHNQYATPSYPPANFGSGAAPYDFAARGHYMQGNGTTSGFIGGYGLPNHTPALPTQAATLPTLNGPVNAPDKRSFGMNNDTNANQTMNVEHKKEVDEPSVKQENKAPIDADNEDGGVSGESGSAANGVNPVTGEIKIDDRLSVITQSVIKRTPVGQALGAMNDEDWQTLQRDVRRLVRGGKLTDNETSWEEKRASGARYQSKPN